MTRFQSFRKFRENFKKQPAGKKLGSLNFNIIIVFFIILVSALYLVQINSVASKGFEIKKLELRSEELKENNKKLNLQIAELKSRSAIESRIKNLQMVSLAGGIDYISSTTTAVALNR